MTNCNILSNKGYKIPLSDISSKKLESIMKELTVTPNTMMSNNKDDENTSFTLYKLNEKYITVPKYYGIEKFGKPETIKYNPIKSEMKFILELRDYQIPIVNKCMEHLNEHGGGLLSLPCGLGKTALGLKMACNLGYKTLVVVHKSFLLDQWKDRISQFTNAKIGIIRQNTIDVENKDIVIAMLQSLAKVEYPDSLFEEFNTVVFDETHNMSSKVFSQVLARLCCEYTIGLSATPKRSDGCEYVFKYHIGDIVYQSSSKRKGLHPIIQTIQVNSKEYKEISILNKFTGQNQIQFTSMLSELIDMEKRNRLIIEITKNLVKVDNRRILILSDRRQHVIALKTSLDNDQDVTFTSGLFLGQMKQVELERSKSSQVILATFSAFGEGVSEKDLDTLILITPKKFIGHLKNTTKNESGKLEQIVGRIFRKDHLDKHPLIIDLQDNFSVYKSQSAQRNTFYKQHFNNAVIETQTVNLDDFSLDNISIKSIINKKKKQNLITDDQLEQNAKDLLKHCVIED